MIHTIIAKPSVLREIGGRRIYINPTKSEEATQLILRTLGKDFFKTLLDNIDALKHAIIESIDRYL